MRYLVNSFISLSVFFLTSCAVYTEKRSESLSQAVFATSDSITHARFDLASQYSKQAERLAFPPKTRIKISPIYTVKKSSVLDSKTEEPSSDFRLVVPDHLRHSKPLIENSEEWKDLLKTKEFATRLQHDHENLQKLADDVSNELQKQTEMNNKMISDLNMLQKKVLEKDLAILRRNIVITCLLLAFGLATYLRIKGIL